MYIVLTSGRDYYDESLTMHKSVLNNLERGAQFESYNDHDHNNDNNEPETVYENLDWYKFVPVWYKIVPVWYNFIPDWYKFVPG